MTDAKKTNADQPEPGNASGAGNADSSHLFDATHVFDETPLPQTSPAFDETSADLSAPAKSSPEGEHERVSYFGDYELLDEIARGGMGVVYKARQARLKRIVAIKMILGGQLAAEKDVKRFLVEAEAAANLDHPGIVSVYEFGEHAGSHYFSMAFVDGPSLAEKAGEKPLPATEAADLISKVAEAIAYAHRHGVVHRDLKPANVLIDQDGQPRITDFGLAKIIDADDELTQDGTIMGSIFYMPPEQAAGQTAIIGPPADIYALGAILYKLLTGNPPFQAATSMEILNQVVNQEPVSPRRLNPSIPLDLETICLKCLQKDISHRFASADELAEELGRFLRGEPILSRPISRVAHAWRWCRRNPLTAGLTAGLCAAVLIGVASATTLMNRAQSEHLRSVQQQRTIKVLSNMVLLKTLDETDDWLSLFFQPVEHELLVARDWTRDGVIDAEKTDELNRLLIPLIEHYPQMSSLMIADDRGREHMLLCIASQQSEDIQRTWRCRQTRRDERQGEVTWIEWEGDDRENAKVRTEQTEYDPRMRPWFKKAIAMSDDANDDARKPIQWTEPYVFFTTKDLGITASTLIPIEENDPAKTVVAFDVLLEDITRFTTKKNPTPNGKVFVLTEDAKLVGLPDDISLPSVADWRPLFLKPLADLGQPYAIDAAKEFSFSKAAGPEIRSFQSEGSTWWGAAKPFELGDDLTFWILVLLPESDLNESLTN